MKPPADPKAAYMAERQRLLNAQARRRPTDPQQAASAEDPRDVVAGLMTRCTAWAADWRRCGDPQLVHMANGAGEVTWCSIATAAGRCGCEQYRPGRLHDYGPDGREVTCRACGLHLLDLAGLCEPRMSPGGAGR